MNSTQSQTEAPRRGHNSLRVEGRITCTTRDGVQIDFPILYDKPYNTDEPELLQSAEGHSIELINLLIAQPFAMELARYFRRRVKRLLEKAEMEAAAGAARQPTFNDQFTIAGKQPGTSLIQSEEMVA